VTNLGRHLVRYLLGIWFVPVYTMARSEEPDEVWLHFFGCSWSLSLSVLWSSYSYKYVRRTHTLCLAPLTEIR
jgi:hypothetical protein